MLAAYALCEACQLRLSKQELTLAAKARAHISCQISCVLQLACLQGMTDANEASGQANGGATADQPASPAHPNSSQRALQLQQQQFLHQQQLQLLQQQQQNQLLQQQQILQQAQHQQGLNQQGQAGLLGQLSGLGGQYSQPQMQSNPMGQLPMGQLPFGGMSGLPGQLPQFSEGLPTGANPIQANGMPLQANTQHQAQQPFVGQIPAGHKQQLDNRPPGSSASSIPAMPPGFGSSASSIPAMPPGFGMVGQLPDHALHRPLVGQLPPSIYQQPTSFGFQQQLTSQQLNFPLASAAMPSSSQFGFVPPFSMYPSSVHRPISMVPGSIGGSVEGSVYNFPDSASVMSRGSAAQPTAAPPVVSLASLSTQQKVRCNSSFVEFACLCYLPCILVAHLT